MPLNDDVAKKTWGVNANFVCMSGRGAVEDLDVSEKVANFVVGRSVRRADFMAFEAHIVN